MHLIRIGGIFDPLEQFEVLWLGGNGIFTITNFTIILFLNICLYSSFCVIYVTNNKILQNNQETYIYTAYHFIFDQCFNLIKNILWENLSIKNQQYFTVIFYLFCIILINNLVGLIPFSFTITSSFIVTFFLACTHFVAINLVGLTQWKWQISNLFLPTGVPLLITPFLSLIELVSYIARVFSLSIRLFANMMSGHALLKILIGFAWGLLISGNFLFFISAFPWLIVTLIMFMEVLIGALQAYVFVVLTTIYINDILNMH